LPTVCEQYHVAGTPAHTEIFGASMRGLCAFDAAWPDRRFLGLRVSSPDRSGGGRTTRERKRSSPAALHTAPRREADRDDNGVIDAIQDTTELMDALAAKGFRSGPDMAYHQVEGGEHHESTWARALPEFLRWAPQPSSGLR